MKLVDDMYFEFYDGPIKGRSRKEFLEQVDATSYTRYRHPELIFFHPVNEGMIPVQYRNKLLQAGMLPGVSDFVILEPRGQYHGAMIEMKRANKSDGKIKPSQKDFLRQARARGYFTAVAFGFEQYKKALSYYLAL